MASEGLNSGPEIPPPSTPRKKGNLSRDEKIEIRALRKYAGWTFEKIASSTPYSYRQVQLACRDGPVTPRKKGPVKGLLNTPQKQQLQTWLLEDPQHRRIPWSDLRYFLPPELFGYGETALTTALHSLGYSRVIRPRRIQRTDANRRARVAFAEEQLALRPRPEDWESVIFSDETWATNNPMWKQWITLHDTEDPESFALLRKKPHGWMFWGQFAGQRKGPAFVWEKGYGGINAIKYITHILPLVYRFYWDIRAHVFQQDNAPAHRARVTQDTLAALGLHVLKWPANSPDLNPIENVWHWMKSYLEAKYDIQSLALPELRAAIWEAWEAVPADFLLGLAHGMIRRLRECIDKRGHGIDY